MSRTSPQTMIDTLCGATFCRQLTFRPNHHLRTVSVDGLKVFYREAGNPKSPAVLLLHGFPTSSHMYREQSPHSPTAITWWRRICPIRVHGRARPENLQIQLRSFG